MTCPLFKVVLSVAILWGVAAQLSYAAPPPAKRAAEVVIVATQHFLTDMPDGYTPGHLRALLGKIAPAALLVEADHNVPDPWQAAPLELAKVTRPWAIARNIPVIPIGWNDPTYQTQLGTMFADLNRAGKAKEFNQLEGRFQKTLGEHSATCDRMNSAAYFDQWKRYHAEFHQLSGKDTPWEKWNARISARAIEECRKNAGQRVAIVFGGAHAYFLRDRLAVEKDLRVIPAETFFPLSADDVRAYTKDSDHLQALRLLNFMPGMLSEQQLASLKKNLELLKAFKKYANDSQYFSAKLLMHQGKGNEAMKILADLAKMPRDDLLAFDENTPICDAARLQTCIALDQQRDSAAVLKNLQSIVDDAVVHLSIRQTARGMLEGLKAKQ